MIENKRVDELKLMYKCFVREESNLNVVVCCLSEHIEAKGKEIVDDKELSKDPLAFTKKLLNFKKEIDELLESSFYNNIKFEKGRDTAF